MTIGRGRGGERASEKESRRGSTDALWLETLQAVCGRAAHELKGALNGVSVNLEVVRSRCERSGGEGAPGAGTAAIGKFADAAADQLDAVISMTESLLVLGRSERETVDVGQVLRRIEALLGPAARSDGRRFELDPMTADLGTTSAGGNAPRLAVAAAILAATASSAHVVCRPSEQADRESEGGPVVRLESCDGSTFEGTFEPRVVDAVADAGIHMLAEPSAITISFPR